MNPVMDPEKLEPRVSILENDMQFFNSAIRTLIEGQRALFDLAAGLCRTKADMELLVEWARRYAMYKERDAPNGGTE